MTSGRLRIARATDVQPASSTTSSSPGSGASPAWTSRPAARGSALYWARRSLERPAQPVAEGRAAFAQDALGEHACRLHVGRIVQQRERLLRDVRARALGHAFLARGRVEGDEARLREPALPPRVDRA